MEELSDISLMQKVKYGDVDKLSLLYERYKKPLFAFFYRMAEDKEQSEDLVQMVFYRILKYRKQYRGQGKFTTWMFGIAHNLAMDSFKNKRKIPIPKEELNDSGTDLQEDPIFSAERKEQTQLVRLALRKLSLEKREVLVLSKYHGLKYKEIAEILNVKENSIKLRVFRAIEELRLVYFELAN